MDDLRRVEVWMAMADHFLDTETRHDVPLTALRGAEAGLSPEEARDAWRYEVAPAVSFNLWLVAGEWAGWDRDWLVKRIEALRPRRRGVRAWLSSRPAACPLDGVWSSIERCLHVLLRVPREARAELARDLAFLARHCFDFCAEPLAAQDPARQERIRALFPEPILELLTPAFVSGEASAARQRLALAVRVSPVG